jgi:hypothetical protein
MGRRKKKPPPEGQGPYIIQSEPLRHAPQPNGQELADAAHWYWAKPGWTTSKPKAAAFNSPSDAVDQIAKLRRVVNRVELTLVPVVGGVMYRPY